MSGNGLDKDELRHLERAVDLAEEALRAGDQPFGSVLVAADGSVWAEARNEENTTGDATRHPEIDLARWAAERLTPEQRAEATVFTSGEHCPMCSAAHAWVGLGRIVYAHSTGQLVAWRAELGLAASPVRPLSIREVAPGVPVHGPVPAFEQRLRDLHQGGGRRSTGP